MGKLSFTGIGVSDLTKSSKFYQDILGLEEKCLYKDIEIDLADGNNFFVDDLCNISILYGLCTIWKR